MNRVKISIVIPYYNCEKYLERLFLKLNKQRTKDFEVIFVNDGSNDNGITILENILLDSKLDCKIINQKNKGVSVARNVGIEKSSGEYIYFLDPDDYIDSEFSIYLDNIIDNKLPDMIFFNYKTIINDKEVINKLYKNQNIENDTEKVLKMFVNDQFAYHMCSFLIKREIINRHKIRFVEGARYGEDHEFIIKCISKSNNIIIDNKQLFNYCLRSQSATQTYNKNRVDSIYSAIRVYEYIKGIYDSIEMSELGKKYVANKIIGNLRSYSYVSSNKSYSDMENELYSVIKKYKEFVKYYGYKEKFNLKAIIYRNTIYVSPKIFIKTIGRVLYIKGNRKIYNQ